LIPKQLMLLMHIASLVVHVYRLIHRNDQESLAKECQERSWKHRERIEARK